MSRKKSNKKKNGKKGTIKSTKSNNNTPSRLPNFHENDNENNTFPSPSSSSSFYNQYKRASHLIKEDLMLLLPKQFPLRSLNDLARASDFIFDQSVQWSQTILDSNSSSSDCSEDYDRVHSYLDTLTPEENAKIVQMLLVIPKRLLVNLDTSIGLRSKVMNMYSVAGMDDEGHEHCLKILKYCQTVIKSCRLETRVVRNIVVNYLQKQRAAATAAALNSAATADKKKEAEELNKNRFESLMDLDDDENDQEDNDEGNDTTNENYQTETQDMMDIIKKRKEGIETAPVNNETDIFTIDDDLIKGDDRMQACAFLYNMEILMGFVAENYKMLKKDVRETNCTDPEQLMQCAMAANNCIKSMRVAEASLALDCPHLNTFYNVLVVVFQPFLIQLIEKAIPNNAATNRGGRKSNSYRPKVIELLGKFVESSFQSGVNFKRLTSLIRDFCKDTKADKAEVDKWCFAAKMTTTFETMTSREAKLEENKKLRRDFQKRTGLNQRPHQWFSYENHSHIGGERSILNTHRWLQTIAKVHLVNPGAKLAPEEGTFGTLWNEKYNLATSFHGDLDSLYCGIIVPEFIATCKPMKNLTALDAISQYTPEVFPIFDLLRIYLNKGKAHPIPASLSFGMHCILTSVIELQGDDDVNNHATNAEKSWNMLFDQLEKRIPLETTNYERVNNDMALCTSLRLLAEPVGPNTTPNARLAFFNPLMAGSFLLFANYVIGVGLGSRTVDCNGQLKIVLHLYNALKQSGNIKDGIPLLEEINTVFKDTKPIWTLEGDKPTPGQFCKRFLMSWGFTLRAATDAVNQFKRTGEMNLNPNQTDKDMR